MNVLIVAPVFPPNIGGIESHTLNLAKELINAGNSVNVLTTKIGLENNPEARFDFPVYRINAGLSSNADLARNGKKMIPQMAVKCLELCRKHKIDVIHAHCPFSLLSAVPSRFLLGKKIILTVHGNWINCVKGSRYYNNSICTTYEVEKCSNCMKQSKTEILFKQKVLRFSAQQADQIIAVSNDVKNSIQLSKNKFIHVIPNISASFSSKNSKTQKDLLFIGSMHEEKGAIVLVKAISLLKKSFPNISAGFVFAHKNEKYFEQVKKQIELNNLEQNIDFFEKIPNKTLKEEIIPAYNMIVLPSLWPEPCSTVITEAMNAGKIIIASNVGGNSDLICHNVNGLLFDSGNENDLSEKIEMVLKNKKLNELIQKNSIQSIKNELNWEKIGRKTLNVYRSALM